jgi:hypothetical protein
MNPVMATLTVIWECVLWVLSGLTTTIGFILGIAVMCGVLYVFVALIKYFWSVA